MKVIFEKGNKLHESAGNSTVAGETPLKEYRQTVSDSKKRSTIEGLSLDEKMSELEKEVTLKKAPLNDEILEELEQIRLNYKGKGDDMRALEAGKALDFVRNLNVPLLDVYEVDELRHISEDVKLKVQ